MKRFITLSTISLLFLFLISCSKQQVLSSTNDGITYWDSYYYCLVLDETSSFATLYKYTISSGSRSSSTVGSAKYALSGDRIQFTPILYVGDSSVYGYLGPTESAQFDETKSHITINIDNYEYTLSRSVIRPSGLN